MARRRGDPSASLSPEHFTYPTEIHDLKTAFSRKASPKKPISRKQTERLPTTTDRIYYPGLDEEEIFEEPAYKKLSPSQLPSFEEPSFNDQPTGRNGLIPDSDDDEMDTDVADRAANAQLRAEAARQARRSPIRATQGGTSFGQPTSSKRSASPLKGGPAAKKITFAPTPQYPGLTGPMGPLSYLRDQHAMGVPAVQLTPQERKDAEIDAQVMEELSGLRGSTQRFCTQFFDGKLDFDTADLQNFLAGLKTGTTQTVQYAGAIADGGPNGLKGWVEIIRDPGYRQALVYGIIHRVLKEYVFGALLFGGPAELVKNLETLEKEQKDEDGFIRASSRAQAIASYELDRGKELHLYDERGNAIRNTATQIEQMILPIYALKFQGKYTTTKLWKQSILAIVTAAADLSVFMRRNGDSVLYHFFPVFKGEDLDPVKMDFVNLVDMYKQHESFDQKARASAFPLVRVICAFHLVAYRKHGGVMAERILEKEENRPDMTVAPELRSLPRNVYKGRIITAKDGFRSKFLAKAVVAGRFGNQIGIAKKDEEDGSVELMDTLKTEGKEATSKCGVM